MIEYVIMIALRLSGRWLCLVEYLNICRHTKYCGGIVTLLNLVCLYFLKSPQNFAVTFNGFHKTVQQLYCDVWMVSFHKDTPCFSR